MSRPSLLERIVAAQGTAWCPTCRTNRRIVDLHDEPGPPDHRGACQMYAVTDLACGHSDEQPIAGALDWVI